MTAPFRNQSRHRDHSKEPSSGVHMPSIHDVVAVILGEGRGTRLHPRTQTRAKPAVPIAGDYRLIDVPISNCINPGIHRITVLTQSNSDSVHHHIASVYNIDKNRHWAKVFPGAQTSECAGWCRGTADAVRKRLARSLRPKRSSSAPLCYGMSTIFGLTLSQATKR